MPTLDEIARTFPGVRVFRLADDGRHAYCNAQDAFLGRGTPLLERAVDGTGRAHLIPRRSRVSCASATDATCARRC
jgi:hypothetical protein